MLQPCRADCIWAMCAARRLQRSGSHGRVAVVPNPTGEARSLGTCTLRFRTLGEIVIAVIGAGFTVTRLEEHPDWTDADIPGTFSLMARG